VRSPAQACLWVISAAGLFCAAPALGDEWKYVVPRAGDRFEHPATKALTLDDARPPDLREKVSYRGARRQYARVCFGSPGSRLVVVVLDRVSDAEADLYVDANRDRVIEAEDRVAGQNGTWRTTLDAAVIHGEKTTAIPRRVIFQLSRTGTALRLASCGFVEGTVTVGGRPCAARRTDADANGLFADPQDRLWIDLNRDGRWDPVEEQFLYAPILVIGGTRYAVRGDDLGARLGLEEIRGTATLRLALAPGIAPQAADLSVSLVGRDGSVVTLSGNNAETTVPVGECRASAVHVSLKDPAGGPPWNYAFAENNRRGQPVWYSLQNGGRVTIDPIGKAALDLDLVQPKPVYRPGEQVIARPWLRTGDGLVLVAVSRGEPGAQDANEALRGSARLVTRDGAVLATGSTQFG
jgi:hypothetical protein